MRFETSNGTTLETSVRKLHTYLDKRRAEWPVVSGQSPGDAAVAFREWARTVVEGALRNLGNGSITIVD